MSKLQDLSIEKDQFMSSLQPIARRVVRLGDAGTGIRFDWIPHVPCCKAIQLTCDSFREVHAEGYMVVLVQRWRRLSRLHSPERIRTHSRGHPQ